MCWCGSIPGLGSCGSNHCGKYIDPKRLGPIDTRPDVTVKSYTKLDIELAVQQERERCVEICRDLAQQYSLMGSGQYDYMAIAADNCANEIKGQ